MAQPRFPVKLYPARSLTQRIVWIIMGFLVIPLILYTAFLYWDEMQQQKAEIQQIQNPAERALQRLHEKIILVHLFSLFFFILGIGGGLVFLFTRRVAKPLQQLCDTMQRVQAGALHMRYVPDRMGFEINALGLQFNETLDALIQQQQETTREKLEKEKFAEELRIGHDIQENLFPVQIPDISALDIKAGYLPAKEVGGDFYDLFLLDNGSLFLAIADAAGKGIAACLYSLGLRSSLRSFACSHLDLAEIVRKANDLFWCDAKETGMFITLWAAIYDPKQKLLTYCNQGHIPPLLMREGHFQELSTVGIGLGVQPIDAVKTASMVLQPNDLLFLYTDGVIEAHNPDRQLFGQKRLFDFLARSKDSASALRVSTLIEELHDFAKGTPQHDDITVVSIQISS